VTTIDEILAGLNPRRRTASVCLDQDLLDRFEALDGQLTEAFAEDAKAGGLASSARPIAEQVEALKAEIDAAGTPFTFQAVGMHAWSDLIRDHLPRDEDRQQRLDHNPVSFPPAAVAASCVDPPMTVEQATQLFEKLNLAQWLKLWTACLDANTGGGGSPKSLLATVVLRRNGPSSTTPPNGASLADVSSENDGEP
jgi:hypothetical protein